jgi:RNA polymerase sigma factor (sigma-70 family)
VNDTELNSAIARLAANGRDEDAWEKLYRLVYPYLFGSLFRMLRGNRYLAEEAVQEVMMRLLRNLDFSSREMTAASLMSYLKLTLRSVAFDLFRSQERPGHEGSQPAPNEAETADPEDSALSPEDQAMIRFAFDRAMENLSDHERTVMTLHLDGRSIGEIAESMQIAEKTGYNLLSLARKKLREALFEFVPSAPGKTRP